MKLASVLVSVAVAQIVTLACLAPAFETGGRSELTPVKLRCEYLTDPIGIDVEKPRLSWQDVSRRRGDAQSSYRILVASSPSLLNAGKPDLWDSGVIASNQSTQIEYGGRPLASTERAWWQVQVWDSSGRGPSQSKAAFWEKGLTDWHAEWISLPALSPSRPAQYLRHRFGVRSGLIQARAYVAAKGLYHCYLDGKRIDDGELLPGWTDYRKRIQYQTYDITRALQAGEKDHAIGLVLGDGWYCGHVGLIGANNYGTKASAIVQIELRYADGTERVVSGPDWKGTTGPILDDDIMMGEDFDARKQINPFGPNAWSMPSVDDHDWTPVATEPLGDVPLVASASPPVRVFTHIRPKTVKRLGADTYVFDLGQNMVGWARLSVRGPAGTRVKLRFAEMLNPDGAIYTKNLRGARATDTYTLRGQGQETYEPSFTFHGFRYVELTGYPGIPSRNAVTGIVVTSDLPQTGTFSCSDPLVNQLQHNINWGQRGNYLSIPTDCPQRDERLGWMGDAQIFVKTATYNNDIAGFMTKWTQDVVDAQSPEGGFSDVSPRMGDPSDGAPAWGDAGVIVPYTIYRAYGDTRLLANRYDAMSKWVEYIDSANPDHIWVNRANNNFGDWLNVQDDTPRPVLATAYFAYDTQIMTEVAHALNRASDEDHFRTLHDQIVGAFQSHFVSSGALIEGDSQTAYVLALRFGLLPEDQRAAAGKRLLDHILVDRKGHLSTGFVGVGYLNPTLTSIGRPDVAYRLLLNDTYPSWGYSIRQGATTIWERWDGYTKESGFEDPGMNSFNHYSFGSVGEWMYETVAGIRTITPGFDKFRIDPVPGGDLKWVKCSLDSPHGTIVSRWNRDSRGLTLEVAIPANTEAEVGVPCADPSGKDVLEDGRAPHDGVTFLRMEGDHAVFKVPSGRYRFSSQWKQ